MAPVAALALIGILVAAPNASGQAAIDQYTPQGGPAGGSGGAVSGSSDTLGPAGAQIGHRHIAAKPGNGSSSGGSLPLTDYPVTPFVWIVVAVLIAGVLVRVAAPVLGRRGARDTS
ncbi:MAG: hypothetical protein QOD14_1775 [Solirubrobacterales bacterium]|jgi:hypothetical protein|nr:hypothetical protein [Solirubrobacterales bacterium]